MIDFETPEMVIDVHQDTTWACEKHKSSKVWGRRRKRHLRIAWKRNRNPKLWPPETSTLSQNKTEPLRSPPCSSEDQRSLCWTAWSGFWTAALTECCITVLLRWYYSCVLFVHAHLFSWSCCFLVISLEMLNPFESRQFVIDRVAHVRVCDFSFIDTKSQHFPN